MTHQLPQGECKGWEEVRGGEGNSGDPGESRGLPQLLSSKESSSTAEAAGDEGSIPESGRSPGGGHGNPLQYFCLRNPMDREVWQATVYRAAKSHT